MGQALKIIIVVLSLSPLLAKSAEIIHKERSLYSNLIVKRISKNICLQFSIRRDTKNQSCINPRLPKKLIFTYVKMSMSSLLLIPNPKKILIVGLGGGTIPMAYHQLFPTAQVHSVEIDPAIKKVAKKYFGLVENSQVKIFTQDGRVFTKRAKLNGLRYDLIILDAFNGDYIPEHLMTQEYLLENKEILSAKGLLVANTFSTSDLYDHESVTYASVFKHVINFKRPETNNRVMFAASSIPSAKEIMARAEKFQPILREYDVPILDYAKDILYSLQATPDWDEKARVLTDQYSPANLLMSR